MNEHVDTTGWGTLAVVVGMFTAGHWFSQFSTSLVTLVTCIIVAHFLKRELQYRFPPKGRKQEE